MAPFIRETDIRAFDNGDNPVRTSAITVSSIQICIIWYFRAQKCTAMATAFYNCYTYNSMWKYYLSYSNYTTW